MEFDNIPFYIIDWENIEKTRRPGALGGALWQTVQFEKLRVRVVEYSKGYLADHWCQKGHIVYCLEGEFTTQMETGESFQLTKGMSYIVSDGMSSHRSITHTGVKLLIIDGDFLAT
ncbi:MAG: DHCW motif cupin fold protein [Mucilaginibacter sp.]